MEPIPTYVGETLVEGSHSEEEHFHRVTEVSGESVCPCARWEPTLLKDPCREWIGFRRWTARRDCPDCGGEGLVARRAQSA